MVVDLTRPDAPGHTGHQELVNVCSSRAVCAQLVLVNTSMFKFIESQNSPYVRSLVSWVEFHTEKGMLIDLDLRSAKEWRITCYKCYGFGHKGNECMYNTTNTRLICLICGIPGCGRQHHPRDCFKDKNLRDSAESADKSQALDESTGKAEAPGSTSQADASSPTRPTRSEQSKKNLEASRAMKKAARKLAKGQDQEDETQNGEGEATGGNDTKPNDWSTSGGNGAGCPILVLDENPTLLEAVLARRPSPTILEAMIPIQLVGPLLEAMLAVGPTLLLHGTPTLLGVVGKRQRSSQGSAEKKTDEWMSTFRMRMVWDAGLAWRMARGCSGRFHLF